MIWRDRYKAAYERHFLLQYPLAAKDHGLPSPQWPKVSTSNGLTKFIVNYINWSGGNATRINTSGRMIDTTVRGSGTQRFRVKRWIKSTTRRGTADVSSTIMGLSVKWEIKVGKDKPSREQLDEQRREQAAGGRYFFVKTPEEFFILYDNLFVR
jgi:hypothetical protein